MSRVGSVAWQPDDEFPRILGLRRGRAAGAAGPGRDRGWAVTRTRSVAGWAELSPCGTYRYLLGRRLVPDPDLFGGNNVQTGRTCLFIMLNPSTADATTDDPTIRRCCRFAIRERCGALEVVNLFALRATDPAALGGEDPEGPDNDWHVRRAAARATIIVAAWGTLPRALAWRAREVATQLGAYPLHCLGTTADGSPRHPLYVRGNQPLMPREAAP